MKSQGSERRDSGPLTLALNDRLMGQQEEEVAVSASSERGRSNNNPGQLSVPVPSDSELNPISLSSWEGFRPNTAGSQLCRDLAGPRRDLIFLPPKPRAVPDHDEMLLSFSSIFKWAYGVSGLPC